MKKIKQLLLNLSLPDTNNEDNESDENTDDYSTTHLSIGENKNSQILRVTFHPDAFLANSIEMYDQPPLETLYDQPPFNKSFTLELKQYSYKIAFNVTISPKLCELGYVRVDAIHFLNEIKSFIPICLSLQTKTKKHYLYIPMTIPLPMAHQRQGLFDDLLTPTLMIIPAHPKLYRYKLTDSFLWRYQYVRIREFTSLKMDVIGEIACDLSFEIIGYPVRAILPNYYHTQLSQHDNNIINKDLLERKSITDIKQWSVFENSYWVKIQPSTLRKLPLMEQCVDELKQYDNDEKMHYFNNKGYIIQQYLGHTVLQCISQIITQPQQPILISFDTNNNLCLQQHIYNQFADFPTELISHIISYCDFEYVRNVLCCVSKQFYDSSALPSCYHTAIVPSNIINNSNSNNKMGWCLSKCKRVDIYSLICEYDEIDDENDNNDNDNDNSNNVRFECEIEQFHLEFVTQSSIHNCLFHMFDFNKCLKILKLTQCGHINMNKLPDNLQELCLMNTLINIDSWDNLHKLRSLIITKSANLHEIESNGKFLEVIVKTLPPQILESICIWDGEEDNILIIQELIEKHNNVLNVFGIGGRICLYHPFSTIFTMDNSKAYPHLQIITVSCLGTDEIIQLVKEFGHQLRILEMFCPFVLDQEEDIYHWLLDDANIQILCKSLIKLEILMCQGFPLHMKRYMFKWNELKQKFKDKFKEYREKINIQQIPLILFDFGIDLNKVSLWRKTDITKYLIDNQQRLELNFGEGI